MTSFTPEQLNFFKFSSVVLDEFPVALRQVFVYMWDNQVAPTMGRLTTGVEHVPEEGGRKDKVCAN